MAERGPHSASVERKPRPDFGQRIGAEYDDRNDRNAGAYRNGADAPFDRAAVHDRIGTSGHTALGKHPDDFAFTKQVDRATDCRKGEAGAFDRKRSAGVEAPRANPIAVKLRSGHPPDVTFQQGTDKHWLDMSQVGDGKQDWAISLSPLGIENDVAQASVSDEAAHPEAAGVEGRLHRGRMLPRGWSEAGRRKCLSPDSRFDTIMPACCPEFYGLERCEKRALISVSVRCVWADKQKPFMKLDAQETENGTQSRRESAPRAPGVVVVLPTYNHGATVVGVLDGLVELDIPIVVVDDGSTDDTQSRLSRWTDENPDLRVRVCIHAKNSGKAAALRTGFRAARELGATHAATIDADGQLEPGDVPLLIERVRADPSALVLGRRPERMVDCPRRCRIGREYASLALYVESGLRLSDSQCGLRIYPLDLIDAIPCSSSRYSFEAEIIARAAWAGCRVIDVPVRCRCFADENRVSHFQPWRDSLRQAGMHLRLVARALIPWPHRKWPVVEKPAVRSNRSRWRLVLEWINPVRCWRDLQESRLGRLKVATALGFGAWIGTTPFFGMHTALSAYVAWRLHLHPAAVIAGSQVSIPPLGVAIGVVSVAVGHLLLTGSLPSPSQSEMHQGPWTIAAYLLPAWLLGSLVVGFVVGMIVFCAALVLGRAVGRGRDPEILGELESSVPQAG